ncbi:MAG: hypothetical protein ACJ77A_02475 [Actinomycetota bacterium]
MSDYRFELPRGLPPEEEAAVLAALERYFSEEHPPPPSPWALAGRIEASRLGALQTRHAPGGWRSGARMPFARRGTPPFHGRGDAK